MKDGVFSAIAFVVTTGFLSLTSSGCVSMYATVHGFEGHSWPWASTDKVETSFGPPWSDASVELTEGSDHSLLLAGKFAGVRCGAGSPEERTLLGNALDSGVLRMRDEVFASYQITSGWRLPGAEDTLSEQPHVGFLGVRPGDEEPQEERARGVRVGEVLADGPAEKAGLRVGDRIVAFDGKSAGDWNRLHTLIADTAVGKTVRMKLVRDGKDLEIEVTVGEKPSDPKHPRNPAAAVGGTTGLILANDGDMYFVLARTERGWVRCRSGEITNRRASGLKETLIVLAWVPAWIGLAITDGACIATPIIGWYLEYLVNEKLR